MKISDVLDSIVDHLISLHAVRGARFGAAEDPRHLSFAEFWMPRFASVCEEAAAADVVGETLLDRIDAVRDHLPDLLSIDEAPVLTHYDIWSGNVMVDSDGSSVEITGYIDVQGRYADRARELSFMALFGMLDARSLERYTASHPLDAEWSLRAAAYNLKMNLKHIVMYPGEHSYRTGAEECLVMLERAVAGGARFGATTP